MSCASLDQLARAATDDTTLEHAAGCPRCAALLDEQRSVRALAQGMRPARLSAERRAELAAEVMAQADAVAPTRPGRFVIAAGVGLAVAVLAVVLATRAQEPDVPRLPVADDVPAIRVPVAATSPELAPAAEPLARLRSIDADLVRDTTPERDVITLRGGSVSIDASETRAVQVVAGGTRVAVSHARASVVSRGGVIERVAVFAGSVEVMTGTRRHVIVAGQTWDRLPEPPAQPASSLTAFREGWTQLRANNPAAAIASFDRATDPVVAEDAVYWAAVAAERLGNPADARRRFTAFLARFPASPRSDAARTAIVRLP